jgi:hypothetical protein
MVLMILWQKSHKNSKYIDITAPLVENKKKCFILRKRHKKDLFLEKEIKIT